MALSTPCFAMLRPQYSVARSCLATASKSLKSVKEMVKSTGIPSLATPPHLSLHTGNWVKFICGASFEDVVDIRNLSLVYTLAGVDCIDCAADESVVNAVNEGIEAAQDIVELRRPWIMISINDDDKDVHFRKAEFDPEECPLDCSRPCENVCPANAISLEESHTLQHLDDVELGGVITERCYGCGRCSPVCPYDRIRMVTHLRDVTTTSQLLKRDDVDAVEIHTGTRETDSFKKLWEDLGDSVNDLRLVAISLPEVGDSTTSVMNAMFTTMRPNLHCYNLWQLDGRPMSGDIGQGATRKVISFAVNMAAADDRPPGFLQLAGGTNAHTVTALKKKGLFRKHSKDAVISGVAFGGYARKIVGRVLRSMESEHGLANIEDHPEYLEEALRGALDLAATVKCYDTTKFKP